MGKIAKTSKARKIESLILKSELARWKDFKFIQPENFKDLTVEAYERLKTSIVNNSFVESFKVWREGKVLYCLDGYHRCKVLEDLERDGFEVPERFPADFLRCRDRKEAARLVLIFSSVYARPTSDGLYEFLSAFDLSFEAIRQEIDLPSINLERFSDEFIETGGMEIEKESNEHALEQKNVLRFGTFSIPMSDEELEHLTARYERFTEKAANNYGFVTHLLAGRK